HPKACPSPVALDVKALIKQSLPAPLWAKLFKLRHEVWRGWRDRKLTAELLAKIGNPTRPIGGPFAGMHYLSESTGSVFFPKLLGTYELEIRESVEWIVHWSPDLIINVGCAEGYYAVGLAMRCAPCRSVAFDIDSRARRLVSQLARLNHVENRMEVRRKCTCDELEPLCASADRPCVVCDCEGFEKFLLDPAHAPSLSKAVILVEVHDCFQPGLSPLLRERFQRSHVIAAYSPQKRAMQDLPAGVSLEPTDAVAMMDEGRSESCWMLMVPTNVAQQFALPAA
ncbi:MAG TPA: hypothetical protein VHM90_08785, partial [Phycisphaerae bacterium]|nr:hypothetical protein [Phycisphaerae bacterium]